MKNESSAQRQDVASCHAVDGDMQTVLRAWHEATVLADEKQQALSDEVQRLTGELNARDRRLSRATFVPEQDVTVELVKQLRNQMDEAALHLNLLRRRLLDDRAAFSLWQQVESRFAMMDVAADNLVQFSAPVRPAMQMVNLRAVLQDVCTSLLPRLSSQGVVTTVDVPGHVMLTADPEMLRRAVMHVMNNALEAMPRGGEVVMTSFSGSRGVELEIADSGPGLSDGARSGAFQPFFTTKQAGFGLGLSLVARMMAAHGGAIEATNCPEGGAAFTLRFPRAALKMAA